ncbi:MAG: urease accessory protein UreE [Candidatus Rokubacteria bacterium]|nr:urease accessory protein UreE [Candidatus Rokubacteria bacterium]
MITEPRMAVAKEGLEGRERDVLALSWEERRWTRKRVFTAAGRELALALPTGSALQPGDVIAVTPEWYVEVEARPEPVLAVFPRTRAEAIRLAFDVGNRHFSLALDGEGVLLPDDTAMEQLVSRLGLPWERRAAVYDPIGAGGHRHDAGQSRDAGPGGADG